MNGYLANLERVFLATMEKACAGDFVEASIPDFPGMKTIRSTWGSFTTIKGYFVPSSEVASGITTIFHDDVPVWVMHYGGRYPKIALPFLKSCLVRAYLSEGVFYGGRGPLFVRNERFTYINTINKGSFDDFEGEERIFDFDERQLGSCWYRGMVLR